MQYIVDIRKLRNLLGKAACGFQNDSGETQQGLTIEQTLEHLLDSLVEDDSFYRDFDKLEDVTERVRTAGHFDL